MLVYNNKVLLIFFFSAFLLFSCNENKQSVQDGKNQTLVKAISVVKKPFDNNLNSFGSITYKMKNDITAQVEGTIGILDVKEGDTVRINQQIARLQNVQMEIQKEQYENSLISANAALAISQTKLQEAKLNVEGRLLNIDKNRLNLVQQELELEEDRNSFAGKKELWEIGGITDTAFKNLQLSISSKETGIAILKKEIEILELGLRDSDLMEAGFQIASNPSEKLRQYIELNTRSVVAEIKSAEANVLNAEKSLDAMQRLLDKLIIRSSVSGVVGALYFENGEFIPQNEKLATIMDISSVYAVFYIQEQDIINFSQGTPLEIEIPSFKKFITATIDEISPIANPQSGNFSVKAEIQNEDLGIKPGMFIKCVIPRVQDISCPVIPETALLQKNGNEGAVFCILNNFAVIKTIYIQAQKDGFIWVASGINENDVVIDKPSPFLKEGEHVEYQL
jgi:multidrug efflux pump subunit AcrA (membrane-fusion protein)